MNLRKRFLGQYTLICMFAAFIIFTLIVGIIVQLQNIRDYKEEIYTLKYELNSTKTDIKNLKNDDSYNNNEELENLARNKLGMIKQNEIIYLEK
ncbi:FtsB family cell division protein [Intestinibacter bartlettii]|uniref:FtsB family cell division protein n=1 Tax=Intestinibacter bartlettii TaxID=261299 RepID=UPI0039F622A4